MTLRAFLIVVAPWFLAGCAERPVTANCPSLLPGWTQPKDGMDPHGWHATITVAGETVLWDGSAVSDPEFQKRLQAAPKFNPVLHVIFDPKGARSCQVAKDVRDEIDRLADCRGEGLCGQGSAADFKRLRDMGAVWRVKQERPAPND
jgi:hypothetical protein